MTPLCFQEGSSREEAAGHSVVAADQRREGPDGADGESHEGREVEMSEPVTTEPVQGFYLKGAVLVKYY